MLLAVLLLFVCSGLSKKSNVERIIDTVVAWNIWSFLLVELLSLLHALNRFGILCGWGSLDIGLVIVVWLKRKSIIDGLFGQKCYVGIGKGKSWHVLSVFLALVVLGLAIGTVPYNWDSMTYHLSRIAYWAQNATVEHYAVEDVRQLSSPVLAEFVNVQVFILSGYKDQLLNLLQAGSYILNAFLVYEIARKIGCKEKFALLGTLLFMTMPIAFGEALTTQVDQFAAIWFLIFIYYFIDLYESEIIVLSQENVLKSIVMGLCISFGYLAKPSVNIGMAVLLLFLLIKSINRKAKYSVLAKLTLCVLPFVVLPLIPELIRNYQTFSAFSSPITGKRQLIGTIAPNYMFINMVKNFAHNIPNIYLYDSTEWIAKIVVILAGIFKVDINDVSISEDGQQYVMNSIPAYGHDSATNPVVVILAVISFIYCIMHFKINKSKGRMYTIYVMTTFMIFCALVRWEPFVSRYMLAYLAALCPMIAWQVQEISGKGKNLALRQAVVPIIYFCIITEAFSLIRYHQEIWHEEASVRPDAYFYYNKSPKEDYFEVTQWTKDNNYQKVGLCVDSNQFLWPIWSMLGERDIQIQYVLVKNNSSRYENFDFIPDCIITDRLMDNKQIEVHGRTFKRVEEFANNENLWAFVRIN